MKRSELTQSSSDADHPNGAVNAVPTTRPSTSIMRQKAPASRSCSDDTAAGAAAETAKTRGAESEMRAAYES